MMTDWWDLMPGDKAVCVNLDCPPEAAFCPRVTLPTVGEVYTIEYVENDPVKPASVPAQYGLVCTVKEIDNNLVCHCAIGESDCVAFFLCWFRPLQKNAVPAIAGKRVTVKVK